MTVETPGTPATTLQTSLERLLAVTPSQPGAHALMPVPVSNIGEELAVARRVSVVARDGFEKATCGIGGFAKSTWQKIDRTVDDDFLFNGFAGAIIGGGVAGFATWGWLIHNNPLAREAAVGPGLAVFGVACALEGAAMALGWVSAKVAKRQAARRVQHRDIDAVVGKLEQGTPFERAVASKQIETWLVELDRQQRVTPEARERLSNAEAALRSASPDANVRARRLKVIADIIDGSTNLTISMVDTLGNTIDELDPSEKHQVATLAAEVLRNSRRPKDYAAEHAAYELPKRFAGDGTPPVANAA